MYKHKYLKYKAKYLDLIHQYGNARINNKKKINRPDESSIGQGEKQSFSPNPMKGRDARFDFRSIKNKIYGGLYGLLVGDALGSRYEFLEKDEATLKVKKDMVGDKLPILGGGPFEVFPGQITDDSEMTISLLKSLAEKHKYDQVDVAKKYIEWFESEPIDIGKTIASSLHTRKPSKNNLDMVKNSMELNMSSLSNGVLMRILPLALYGVTMTNDELKKSVNSECDLTHPNPIIKDACYIYSLCIKYILEGLDKNEIFEKIYDHATTPRVKIIIKDAMSNPEPTYMIDGKESYVDSDSKKYQGYFGIALQNTLYEFYKGDDLKTSFIEIIKRGGDVDTNLAIAGGLLGAYYGKEAIPSEWIDTVLHAEIQRYKKYPMISPKMVDMYITKLFR